MTKNAGELEKYEARWARRSNGPRRSASPRSMGCLSDINRPCDRCQWVLGWTPDHPTAARRWTQRTSLAPTGGRDLLAGPVSRSSLLPVFLGTTFLCGSEFSVLIDEQNIHHPRNLRELLSGPSATLHFMNCMNNQTSQKSAF